MPGTTHSATMGTNYGLLWKRLTSWHERARLEHHSLSSCNHQHLRAISHVFSPYDRVRSWNDCRAQFELVAELNCWDNRTKAIYLAASLQVSAHMISGDLDPSKWKDFSALIEALESRCCTRKHDETLPQSAQTIQRLARQAYPDLQDTVRFGGVFTKPGLNPCKKH